MHARPPVCKTWTARRLHSGQLLLCIDTTDTASIKTAERSGSYHVFMDIPWFCIDFALFILMIIGLRHKASVSEIGDLFIHGTKQTIAIEGIEFSPGRCEVWVRPEGEGP